MQRRTNPDPRRRSSDRRRPPDRSTRRPPDRRRRPDPRRRPVQKKRSGFWRDLNDLFVKRKDSEFRPDSLEPGLMKKLYMTRLQRLHLLRWGLYVLICILLLIIQDVLMSRVVIFGATTDLCVAALLLITVMEGANVGSIFILISSVLYYFSGSAPGPFCVALLTVFGMFSTLFRQAFWHRNKASILLCSGMAVMLYELGVYVVGLVTGLTNWYSIEFFLVTGALSWLVMLLLYPLLDRVGQIGGYVWKE